MADKKEALTLVCGLFLTENKQNKKTYWCAMRVVLVSVFWILHVSVTSLFNWLHVTFDRLQARLSLGNTPHPGLSGQDDPTC